MESTYYTSGVNETFECARKLGEEAYGGMIVALKGDLAAGKTVFAKGFAAGMGVKDIVNSPTFTIMQIYESGRLPLYHFDVYRLEDSAEMEEIGYDEYFFSDGVCLIEWADLIRDIIPESALWVEIIKDLERGEDFRVIRLGS